MRQFARSLCSSFLHRQRRLFSANTAPDSLPRTRQRIDRSTGGDSGGGWLWILPFGTALLGAWQLQRLQWKLGLIKQAEKRILLDPVVLSSDSVDLNKLDEAQFTRVTAFGEFQHDKEILLGPRTFHADPAAEPSGGGLFGGPMNIGYYVYTPFKLADGNCILVNRGWIPRDLRHDTRRKSDSGATSIEGVVRQGESVGALQKWSAPNKPEKNEWHAIDLAQMAAHTGTLPLIVQMISGSPINEKHMANEGQPLLPRVHAKLRNNHLEYALTWFGLCAATSFLILYRKNPAFRISRRQL